MNRPDQRTLSTYNLQPALKSSFPFIDSSILTANERSSLTQMFDILTDVKLIYRASRDGFEASSFHSKCNYVSNTVTIIKTTSDSVFGGFTSKLWSEINAVNDYYYFDGLNAHTTHENAFIFSLRRLGYPKKQRLNVTQKEYAIYNLPEYGPIYGGDIYVSGNSDQGAYSHSYLGSSYQLPNNLTYGSVEANSYLAGSLYWKTTEIEVYQVTSLEAYSVSFLHNGCLFLILL